MKDCMKYILILHQLEFEQDCSGIGCNNSCLLTFYNNKVERLYNAVLLNLKCLRGISIVKPLSSDLKIIIMSENKGFAIESKKIVNVIVLY